MPKNEWGKRGKVKNFSSLAILGGDICSSSFLSSFSLSREKKVSQKKPQLRWSQAVGGVGFPPTSTTHLAFLRGSGS